jgi:hypothetical protein
MLLASHLVAGAAVGTAVARPLPRTLAALGTHLVLDGIGHDDDAISPVGQAALGVVTLATLVACCGPTSPAVLGALAGGVPDTEVAADIVLFGGRVARYVFPSHWQIRRTAKPAHPYQFPGPAVPIAVEIALAGAALAVVSAINLRRRRAP